MYLVTGGAGFIGSNISAELLRRGEQVRVLDSFITGKRENISEFLSNPSFTLIEGDLRDASVVDKAVAGCDFILHQGALPSVPRSVKDPLTTNDVNILGTLNILEAARKHGVKRVVYASSSSVYGNNPALPKTEDMPISPVSPYALTKYAGERYCQIYYEIYGLETVCLRYFNVFGPNQDPDSEYSAVIPKFVNIIARGERPVIYGDGQQSRDFTFVANNVAANLLACESKEAVGQVFNIACGERFTLIDLVERISRIMGADVKPEFAPARTGDVKHSLASIDKAKDILKYEVKAGFDEGLRSFIASVGLAR